MSSYRVNAQIIPRLWRWLQNTPGFWRSLLLLLFYVTIGVALEELADLFRSSWQVQPWDPAAGLHIVLLFAFGLRYIFALPIVPFVEDWWFQSPGESLLHGTVSAIGITLFYGAASTLLLSKLNLDPRLSEWKDVVKFATVFAFVSLIFAIFNMSSLLAFRSIEASEWFSKTMYEWAGEATGIGMLAPPLLIFFRKFPWSKKHLTLQGSPPEIRFRLPSFRDTRDWLTLFAVTILFTWAAHGGIKSQGLDYTYFTFVPLTWICAWKGFESATVITFLINVTAVSFVGKNAQNSDTLALQFGLMTVTYIGLLLGAFVSARNRENTRRKDLEAQLRYDATHDSLTGLYNRAWFLERLKQANNQAKEDPNYLFAVLFLDLDRFKIINDSLGHAVGDRLLVEIAQQLQACLSESTPIARFGGDEFTIILEDLTNISQASQIGEIICQQLGRTYTLEGYQVFTTVSIGIASNASDRQEPVNLLRDADIALYEAKTRGKSQYVVFNTQMYDKVVTQAQLEQELRQAIDELDG